GTVSKAQAVLSISTQLVNVESQQTGAAEDGSTIQLYLTMLHDVDWEKNLEPRDEDTGAPQSPQPSEPRRSCEASLELDEHPTKRTRVNPAKYAWAATDFLLEMRLNPNVSRTLELIKLYGEDLPQAKRDVSASPSAPEFPESEWTNVLAGRAIDLDHVFMGRYTATADEKVTEHIGGLEVLFRAPVAAKKVGSFGDWVYAWKHASLATMFAFPHQQEELDAYGEFIIGLFGALVPVIHERVLDFDRAVCKRVGSAKHFSLTDFANFANLKIQYIDSCGANIYCAEVSLSSSSKGRGGRGAGNRKTEMCHNYNSNVGCKALAHTCRFRHSCLGCGADSHKRFECVKNM
ncbi:hypothetical protein BC628DRAFT_1315194, partial [Trametes gibbosa]